MYKVGQFFKHKDDGIYILSHRGKEAALTSLKNGNIWSYPIICENVSSITDVEFGKITGCEEFKLVRVEIKNVNNV